MAVLEHERTAAATRAPPIERGRVEAAERAGTLDLALHGVDPGSHPDDPEPDPREREMADCDGRTFVTYAIGKPHPPAPAPTPKGSV